MPGTRRDHHNLGDFVREHANTVDRSGDEYGTYLGVRVDGKPAAFEQRSLPVNSLELPYIAYRLADEWPPGTKDWTIEHAEIAAAFGRPGGGHQLLIHDQKGKVVKIETLLRKGVLVLNGVAK
ncbi:TNT domain-containing protein [Leifsonia sp. NPDC056665]|uniref:TNT domain-containing protein n=1 Tax=Leifsonia sp. NPDC056665 TaxID=3345901 RepID=UPI003692A58A